MNIKGMHVFVSILEEGSLARASERIHLSQPAASRLLRLFEETVGEPLFFRAGRRLVPTQEAELLYPEAVRILDAIGRLPQMIERGRSDSLLPIRILCLPRIVDGLVLPAMARLHAIEPHQRFQLEIVSRRELGRRLIHRDFDIGVATNPVPLEGMDSRPLTDTRLHVMLSRADPLSRRDVLEPSDMVGRPYIALSEYTVLRRTVERELAVLGQTLNIAHEVSSSAAAYRMVRYGMGFTFADPLSVDANLMDHVRLVKWRPASALEIVAFYPRGAQRQTNRERFVEQLERVCQARTTDASPLAERE